MFYDDVSDYSTTKLFGADTLPEWNLTDKIINIKSVEKTVIFVAKPIQVINALNEITKFTSSEYIREVKNSSKWGAQQL